MMLVLIQESIVSQKTIEIQEGNGFGLYVAKGAIEGQGGKLWFTSVEGKGTTFFFELPMKEAGGKKADGAAKGGA